MKLFLMVVGFSFLLITMVSCSDQNPSPPFKPRLLAGLPSSSALNTPTPTPGTGSSPCFNFTAVSVPYPASLSLSSSFAGLNVSTYVIRSMADWQAYCGPSNQAAPPVDFSTQMIIIYYEIMPNGWCGGQIHYSSICEDSNQITVSVTYLEGQQGTHAEGAPPSLVVEAVSVPTSNLPVIWNVIYLNTPIPCPI